MRFLLLLLIRGFTLSRPLSSQRYASATFKAVCQSENKQRWKFLHEQHKKKRMKIDSSLELESRSVANFAFAVSWSLLFCFFSSLLCLHRVQLFAEALCRAGDSRRHELMIEDNSLLMLPLQISRQVLLIVFLWALATNLCVAAEGFLWNFCKSTRENSWSLFLWPIHHSNLICCCLFGESNALRRRLLIRVRKRA